MEGRYLISQRPAKLYLIPIVAAARTDSQNKIKKKNVRKEKRKRKGWLLGLQGKACSNIIPDINRP